MKSFMRMLTVVATIVALNVCGCAGLKAPVPAAPAPMALSLQFQKVAGYKFGDSREALVATAEEIRKAALNPAQLQPWLDQLAALLESPTATDAAKDFACRQLALVGTGQSVPALAPLLTDGNVMHADMARYALEIIPGEVPVAAMRAALPETKGLAQIGLINSLGVRRDVKSVSALGDLLKSGDLRLAAPAARALGKIGTLDAARLLAPARGNHALDGATLAVVKEGYLNCGVSLLQAGEKGRAAKVFLDMYAPSEPLQYRLVALRGLIEINPHKGLSLVLEALKSQDSKLQAAVTRCVREIKNPDDVKRFADQLASLGAPTQILLIDALADRGDAAARAAVVTAAGSHDAAVRVAALKALARLGDASTVGLLAKTAATAEDPDERAAAADSLNALIPADVDAAIVNDLNGGDTKLRVALIASLGARHAVATTPVLLGLATDGDKWVQTEAYKSLGLLGEEKDLPALVGLLVGAKSGRERSQAEKALIATCNRIDNQQKRTQTVLAAWSPTLPVPVRGSMLRVLGGIGGAEAQGVVEAGLADPNDEIQDTALRALADWPDAGPAHTLAQAAAKAKDEKYRVLALRGYVRLLNMPADRSSEETLDLYRAAIELAARPEDKKMVLGSMGQASDPQVLALIVPYLKDADVRAEALASLMSLAQSSVEPYPWLALEAALKVKEVATDESTIKDADKVLKRVKELEDYVSVWEIAGPYIEAGKSWQALHTTAFDPEKPGTTPKWRLLQGAFDGGQGWGVFLSKNQSLAGNDRVAYLRTNLWVPKDIPKAQAYVGSDDGIKMWVNGEVVLDKNVTRAMKPGDDTPVVHLRQGWNPVMLKLTQGDNDWSFSLRFRNPDVSVIEGLKVSPVVVGTPAVHKAKAAKPKGEKAAKAKKKA